MKKILVVALFAVASIGISVAQPRAIGANLGSGLGFSYRHTVGENQIDLNVDVPIFNGWGVGASCTYDWVDPFNTSIPWNERGEWHWQMGVGAGVGIYGFKSPDLYIGAAGHIGVEYDFWFPMQLSFDWRPNIGATIDTGGSVGTGFNTYGLGIASIGIRYLF